MGPFEIAVTVGAAAVAAVVFFVIGYFLRKATAEKKIHSAEAESKRLVDEAKKDAEAAKKEILVEAKDVINSIKRQRAWRGCF